MATGPAAGPRLAGCSSCSAAHNARPPLTLEFHAGISSIKLLQHSQLQACTSFHDF